MNAPKPPLPRPPVFMLIFMSLFGFIGLTLLIYVWFGSERDFPPVIFKVFASFVALGFMAVGFGAPLSMLKARSGLEAGRMADPEAEPPTTGYQCPSCGAGLGQQEVSPSGDAKCSYCLKWWNIHRADQ